MTKSLRISEKSLIRISIILVMFIAGFLFYGNSGQAQIWEPEGLNMPGAWNGWTNPPTNNLALASYTQVTGGRITKYSIGIQHWQTIFSVASSGADVVGGSYNWLFTSGSTSNPWGNKWANVNVTMNTLQSYTYNSGSDNSITVTDGKWYTMNFEDAGYVNTRAIFMETSAEPVNIATVSVPVSVNPGNPVVITITTSQTPCAEEIFFVRYTTDAWATSTAVAVSMTGTTGTATIPGQIAGTEVFYYAFSSVISPVTADYDLYTIKYKNDASYTYVVFTPTPVITFANLQYPQSGNIDLGGAYQVYGRARIPGITGQATQAPGLLAWVGYSNSNSTPTSWINWIPATFNGPVSGNDEFMANLGAAITTLGTWYYATRYSLNGGPYIYGGYSSSGGGFWDGTGNVSGVLTVQAPAVPLNSTLQDITVVTEASLCYDALDTVIVAGNNTFFRVQSGGAVKLIAGKYIKLHPGTTVYSGGKLLGKITIDAKFCLSGGSPESKEAEMNATGVSPTGGFSFNIFPNPASSEVTLQLKGVAEGVRSRVELFGIDGNRVYTNTLNGSENHTLSVTAMPSGVYFVRIISGDHVQVKRLIKP